MFVCLALSKRNACRLACESSATTLNAVWPQPKGRLFMSRPTRAHPQCANVAVDSLDDLTSTSTNQLIRGHGRSNQTPANKREVATQRLPLFDQHGPACSPAASQAEPRLRLGRGWPKLIPGDNVVRTPATRWKNQGRSQRAPTLTQSPRCSSSAPTSWLSPSLPNPVHPGASPPLQKLPASTTPSPNTPSNTSQRLTVPSTSRVCSAPKLRQQPNSIKTGNDQSKKLQSNSANSKGPKSSLKNKPGESLPQLRQQCRQPLGLRGLEYSSRTCHQPPRQRSKDPSKSYWQISKSKFRRSVSMPISFFGRVPVSMLSLLLTWTLIGLTLSGSAHLLRQGHLLRSALTQGLLLQDVRRDGSHAAEVPELNAMVKRTQQSCFQNCSHWPSQTLPLQARKLIRQQGLQTLSPLTKPGLQPKLPPQQPLPLHPTGAKQSG